MYRPTCDLKYILGTDWPPERNSVRPARNLSIHVKAKFMLEALCVSDVLAKLLQSCSSPKSLTGYSQLSGSSILKFVSYRTGNTLCFQSKDDPTLETCATYSNNHKKINTVCGEKGRV